MRIGEVVNLVENSTAGGWPASGSHELELVGFPASCGRAT
jgi:hypothetical protein